MMHRLLLHFALFSAVLAGAGFLFVAFGIYNVASSHRLSAGGSALPDGTTLGRNA
jgi:hypothetical protein